MAFLTDIYNWFVNFPWEGLYSAFRVIFIALDALLIFGFVWVFKKAWEYRPDLIGSFRRSEEKIITKSELKFDVENYARHWEKIREKSMSNPPESFTLAIVAADNLVGDALDDMSLEGEHIAEKLQKLNPKEIKTLNDLWRAHRLRNDLVHTTGFEIKENEAEEILNIYESFLKELGALE
jgi:hypothetical protein